MRFDASFVWDPKVDGPCVQRELIIPCEFCADGRCNYAKEHVEATAKWVDEGKLSKGARPHRTAQAKDLDDWVDALAFGGPTKSVLRKVVDWWKPGGRIFLAIGDRRYPTGKSLWETTGHDPRTVREAFRELELARLVIPHLKNGHAWERYVDVELLYHEHLKAKGQKADQRGEEQGNVHPRSKPEHFDAAYPWLAWAFGGKVPSDVDEHGLAVLIADVLEIRMGRPPDQGELAQDGYWAVRAWNERGRPDARVHLEETRDVLVAQRECLEEPFQRGCRGQGVDGRQLNGGHNLTGTLLVGSQRTAMRVFYPSRWNEYVRLAQAHKNGTCECARRREAARASQQAKIDTRQAALFKAATDVDRIQQVMQRLAVALLPDQRRELAAHAARHWTHLDDVDLEIACSDYAEQLVGGRGPPDAGA